MTKVGHSALVATLLLGCSGKYDAYKESRIALGTVVEITVAHGDEDVARRAMARAFEEIERIEALLSTHRAGSETSRLNGSAKGERVPLSHEAFELLDRSRQISAKSGGAFDVTVGPLLELWNFSGGGTVPEGEDLDAALEKVGYMSLELDADTSTAWFQKDGMKVDLGAVGKGYAVDRAVAILRDSGIERAIVDAGGDLRLLGGKPGKGTWRIGIRHPRKPGKLLVSLDLADASIVTSGDYERFFVADGKRYHHLIDPATGQPARGCQNVTVIAVKAAEADALATAAFVMGAREGIAFLRGQPGVEGIIVDTAGELLWTDKEKFGK